MEKHHKEIKKTSEYPLKRLIAYTRSHYLWLMIAVLSSILAAITTVLTSKILGRMADTAVAMDLSAFMKALLFMVILLIVEVPANILRTYGTGKFTEFSLFDIRHKTTDCMNHLPVSYLDTHASGDLLSRINNDISVIQQFLQNNLGDLIAQPLFFIGAVVYSFIISWKLTLFSFITIPILMILTMKISKPVEKHTKEQQEALGKVNAIAQDAIAGLTVSKSFNLHKILMKKNSEAVDQSVAQGLKVAFVQAVIAPVNIFMQMLPFILVFAYGGYLVIHGEITFGGLLAFINLSNNVVNPLAVMPQAITSLRSSSAASARIFEIWDETREPEKGKDYENNQGEEAISFHNILFSYPDGDPVFNGLSFTIRKGERLALVGHSGCGKSTTLKLLMGFYRPLGGTVAIYGHDIQNWKLEKMRSLISYVSQDTYLFPESIYANIAYGKENATPEEVMEAARAAGIYDTIQEFSEKFDTVVGERGVKLSGGQRQRIAIARALLKDAPILLLDEATSALDVESEHEVQKALEGLMEGRTTLVIAHRLSTIKNVDRILVMNEGQIVESGTHEMLLQSGTLYSQLYLKQFAAQSSINPEFVGA